MILSALEMRDISKYFGAVKALSHFTMALKPGEIHALVGENGAGKSTLIKIMTGVHQPTGGEILVNDIPVTFKTTQDARDLGIVAIYQEPMVFPDLDVVENIFISNKRYSSGSSSPSSNEYCGLSAAHLRSGSGSPCA